MPHERLTIGMNIVTRGERFTILDMATIAGEESPIVQLTLRGLEGELQGEEITVLAGVDEIEPDELPNLELDRVGRLPRFRLLHDVFSLKVAPPSDALVGVSRSRIRIEPYQYVPALRALELPRPRLLLADDVGLGKTIEAGLILRDLAARRRANRILVVCPASIMGQWQQELQSKFGFRFRIFDRDEIHETRLRHDVGTNPWAIETRVIASMDFIKRREGAFRGLSSTKWDVVIVDEAHHLAAGRSDSDITDRHRLGRWLSDATDALLLLTATPHDGYDESFTSLLGLLEPSLVLPSGPVPFSRYGRYLVRRLKRQIKNPDGSDKFRRRQVVPIAVGMTPEERSLHSTVMSQAKELEDLATTIRQQTDAEAIRLVATILRKRAASSRAALSSTIQQRRENLSDRLEELEIQRDHLRALRRGDTVSDESLARLERDAHRSYLSVMRRLGQRVRRAESEQEQLDQISGLLETCSPIPDSKIEKLLETLRDLHSGAPDDKVIVFSEYSDTVTAIKDALEASPDYRTAICTLTGDDDVRRRTAILEEFASDGKLILVATDAAGEGLNLHHHCHRIIHFELPWNPNRLEQRNGRVDRYGQQHEPVISFLYAEQTYEGEVLSRLVNKIERQIDRLGSVGDVLGQIQAERIEQIVARSPERIDRAIRQAEQEIDDEIARASNSRLPQILGDGRLDEEEVGRAEEAAERGSDLGVDYRDFLKRAVLASPDGRIEFHGESISVVTPSNWRSQSVQGSYDNLVALAPGEGDHVPEDQLLHEGHPLLVAASRWVKASRFSRDDDHRLAYVLTSSINEPDLVATFLVQLLDGTGQRQERIEAVRVGRENFCSQDRTADLAALRVDSEGNVDLERLPDIFGPWWDAAKDTAQQEAVRRATGWRREIIALRTLDQDELVRELNDWNQASRQAILRGYQDQPNLFGESNLPPAVRRKLNQHNERYRQRRDYLARRVEFAEPSVEPIGVLLRVPTNMSREGEG